MRLKDWPLFLLLLILLSSPTTSFAEQLQCVRSKCSERMNWSTYEFLSCDYVYERVHTRNRPYLPPDPLNIPISAFRKKGGVLVVDDTLKAIMEGPTLKHSYKLMKNGLLHVEIIFARLQAVNSVFDLFYNCDKTVAEVVRLQNAPQKNELQPSSSTSEKRPRSLTAKTDKPVMPEQPRRDYQDGYPKTFEIEKKCTSLGFTAGTEKHGDCVMKLLDY